MDFPTLIMNKFFSESDINIHISPFSDQLLLLIRILCCVVINTTLIYTEIDCNTVSIFIIYLTDQGFLFANIYFNCCLLDYFCNFRRKKQRQLPIIKDLEIWIQLFGQIAVSIEVIITVAFWCFLFKDVGSENIQDYLQNIMIHLIPIICLGFDFLLNGFDFPLKRIVIIAFLSLFYIGINATYTVLYRPVYSIIDWKKQSSYFLILLCLLSTILVYLIGKLVYNYIKLPLLNKKRQEYQLMVQNYF